MDDLISRQALCEYALNQKDKSVTPNDIMRFPSAQPYALDEWCDTCKEYDHEKQCCPRYNRVIRDALKMRKRGKWIWMGNHGDSRFMCSVCHWKENVPTCNGEPTIWNYCPSCGCQMEGEEE